MIYEKWELMSLFFIPYVLYSTDFFAWNCASNSWPIYRHSLENHPRHTEDGYLADNLYTPYNA